MSAAPVTSISDVFAPSGLGDVNSIYGTGAWITYALIAACFASFLVPILVVLLVFSTHDLRRSLIFHLNVMALFLGIGEGVVLAYLNVYNILYPSNANSTIPGPVLTWLIFSFWSPMIVELVLYLRLWAVFPPTLTSRNVRIIILGIPILSTTARCTVLSYATAEWVQKARSLGTFVAGLQFWPFARIIWCLELFINIYMSTLFIYQLRTQFASGSSLIFRSDGITDRIRALFMISITNFVVPCFFCTAQIVIASIDIQATNLTLFLASTYLSIVNNYITILGVVFATVWSAGSRWVEADGGAVCCQPVPSPSWLNPGTTGVETKAEAKEKEQRSTSPSSSFHCGAWRVSTELGREEDLELSGATPNGMDLEKQAAGCSCPPSPASSPWSRNTRHCSVCSGPSVPVQRYPKNT